MTETTENEPRITAVCQEQRIEAIGPEYRIVNVIPWVHGQEFDGGDGMTDCDPELAMWAAYKLITYAIEQQPELLTDADSFWAKLIAAELAEVMQRAIEVRWRREPPGGLMHYLQQEAAFRHEREITIDLMTARRVGLRSARQLIQDLVAAASEPDATSRLTMLSGLVPDIARTTAGL